MPKPVLYAMISDQLFGATISDQLFGILYKRQSDVARVPALGCHEKCDVVLVSGYKEKQWEDG